MNLLVLSPWFPYPPNNGSRQRIFHLLRELSRTWNIRLVTGTQDDSPPEIPPELHAVCSEIVCVPWLWHEGGSGGAASALRALVSPIPRSVLETPNPALRDAIAAQLQHPTDLLLVCESGMDAYLPDRLPGGLPAVMEGAEVSGLERSFRAARNTGERLRNLLTYRKGMRYWGRQMRRRYCAITAASPAEADALRRAVATATGGTSPIVYVIPNGVDLAAFPPVRDRGAVVPGRLIYNGALTYGANRDAVVYFVNEILPAIAERRPDVHLIVTGRLPAGEVPAELRENARVECTGYLTDIKPALSAAAVCVVPLLAGGGTRLKILEAWAAGVPVVSTSVGADGLSGAVSGEHLLVADDARSFADAVVDLLSDAQMCIRLAANGRTLAEQRYGWEAIGGQLSEMLAGIVRL